MKKQSDKHARESARESGPGHELQKDKALEPFTVCDNDAALTTNQGVCLADTEHSLKAGPRGPTLLEDFHFREKITHFDHEIIPERVVHARGSGAHGFFECAESMEAYTMADFLSRPGKRTPVFVRFSQVVGSRGSKDTARDVRGFAAKFYTDEGNFDLVGNNMPVFFIHDAIKFPDLIHAARHGAVPELVSKVLGEVRGSDGDTAAVGRNYLTAAPVAYDAVYVPGGKDSVDALRGQCKVRAFLMDMFQHCKPMAATGEAVALLAEWFPDLPGERGERLCSDAGVVTGARPGDLEGVVEEFRLALGRHRSWEREDQLDKAPPETDSP